MTPLHEWLLAQADAHFAAAGLCVVEQTYHGKGADPRVKDALQRTFTPTALHIRAAADRYAVHPDPRDGMALRYEAKAGGGPDILAEALPLSDHMHHARRGVLCLYCCFHRGQHRGFWAHAVPAVRTLFIPNQATAERTDWYWRVLPPLFPRVRDVARVRGRVNGSRDPYVAIDGRVARELPTWQELFDRERARQLRDGQASTLWNVATEERRADDDEVRRRAAGEVRPPQHA